jgi:DNA repair protein RadC
VDGVEQSPLERVQLHGMRSASLRDLAALILTRSPADIAYGEKAADELIRIYGLQRMHEASLADLKDLAGLEGFDALRTLAAIQLGRKTALAGPGVPTTISGQEDAYRVFKDRMEGASQEQFMAAYLTAKGQIIQTSVIHQGTLTATMVGPREVFREGVKSSAASVVVAHNHPSGDPEPSPEDIQMTRTLKKAGEILDIAVLDHIIVGKDRYVSLAARGYL